MPNALDKRVEVKVGLTRPRSPRKTPPRVCIVGIATQDSPWLSDIVPDARVKMTQLRAGGTEAVEQVRFSAKSEQGPLPNVASSTPSRKERAPDHHEEHDDREDAHHEPAVALHAAPVLLQLLLATIHHAQQGPKDSCLTENYTY